MRKTGFYPMALIGIGIGECGLKAFDESGEMCLIHTEGTK